MRLVYDYRSFRDFLRDYYREQKLKNSSFSYTVFAKQVGLSSSAHIQLILSGKRRLTVHNVHRMGVAMGLPTAELECFEALVHKEQAETEAEKKYYDRKLKALRGSKPASSSRIKVSALLSNGILPALLLSVDGKTPEQAAPAAVRFGYTADESRAVVSQLLKEGVAELREGVIRLSQRHLILHDQRARSQAQKQFLLKQLRLSENAFHAQYEKEAKFFAHTFTFHEDGLARYLDEIKALLSKVTKLSDEEPPSEVAQLNIQLFPYKKTEVLK